MIAADREIACSPIQGNQENPDNLSNGEIAIKSTIKTSVLKRERKGALVYMSTRGQVKGIRGWKWIPFA